MFHVTLLVHHGASRLGALTYSSQIEVWVRLDDSVINRAGSRGRVTVGDRVICSKEYCYRENRQ